VAYALKIEVKLLEVIYPERVVAKLELVTKLDIPAIVWKMASDAVLL
jgi:hypothetical protein